ncbi:iron-siderophore ABC transporter substrate-binding protein [Vibrio sp. STUT-A11]|uniref:ABC transporter substrate-binding protein n=1 Tax=unclassified Vibrio TaxID=2614977 RepID=UPI002230855A|nr:iron-siderophore ABC transporter substrate-binding protein [Vibrio sp. STUT-A11]BDR15912.1 iron-hydroxamate ABC transporter substrate-binding protein [Vibrio sp. STUT-A11]
MKPWFLFVVSLYSAVTLANPSSHEGKLNVCASTCVTLDKPAVRVVALNWTAAEMLLSLGVTPVGVTEIKGYRKWQTNHPELPDGVTEVGRRQEPNLTEIAKLEPDLIVGYDFRHQRLIKALNGIAPTLLYQQFPQVGQADFSYFQQAIIVFRELATLTGKNSKGEMLVDEMHQTLRDLRQKLAERGMEHKSIAYGKFVGMGYGLRMFSKDSLAGSVANELGLNYSWQSTLPGKDFVHLQLEQLPDINHTHLLLAGNQTDSERMTSSPVWPYLPFVKHHLYSDVEPLWSFGGPISISRMANAFATSLLKWKETSDG